MSYVISLTGPSPGIRRGSVLSFSSRPRMAASSSLGNEYRLASGQWAGAARQLAEKPARTLSVSMAVCMSLGG